MIDENYVFWLLIVSVNVYKNLIFLEITFGINGIFENKVKYIFFGKTNVHI